MEDDERLSGASGSAREVEVRLQDAEGCAPELHEDLCNGEKNQEIVILCPAYLADSMGKAFALMLTDQRLPATIPWSGCSWHSEQGIIVIAWQGKVPGDFLWQLEIDHEISDFIWYDVPTVEQI